MTLEHYEAMLDAKGGVCAICGDAPSGTVLHVDHHHETGVVRGLLCNRCLGLLKDDPAVLRAALAYLEAPRGTSRHHTMSMQSP